MRTKLTTLVSKEDKEKIKKIATKLNCFDGGRPNISLLIRKIASKELILVPRKYFE